MTTLPTIIWDVDGTLVDTAEQHFRAWQRLAEEINQPYSREDFAATFGLRNAEIIPGLFNIGANEALCAELGERKEQYYRESVKRDGVQLLPGVARLLEECSRRGCQQAVGSSAPVGNLALILESTNIRRYFSAVITGDDVSHGKPHPEVFLKAAARIDANPANCIVFEDAVAGVEAAKNAGMRCVAVTFVGHHPAGKLLAAGADLVVASLEEITFDRLMALQTSG